MKKGHGIKIIDRAVIRASRQQLAQKIADECPRDKNTVLVCILKGAAYFMVDLSRDLQKLEFNHSIYFLEASSYKGQKQEDSVQILSQLVPEKLLGKHVILIDELYDNGKTMHTIKTYLNEELNIQSTIRTCVMFKKTRQKPGQFQLPDYVGMEVPDVWLVGYGMDEDGHYRGLKDLWAVPKTFGSKDDWTPDDWKIFINKK